MPDEFDATALAQDDQQDAPPSGSATETAVVNDDVAAYRAARLAERTGQPAPAPAAKVADKPATPPAKPDAAAPAPQPESERQVSKRQQQINESIAAAVARATADLAAENARLRAAAPQPDPATPAPAQTLAQAVSQPDIRQPLMDEGDFFEKFPDAPYAAYTRYITNYELEQREARSHQQTQQQQSFEQHRTRAEGFQAKLKTAEATDPKFSDKLSKDVYNLRPIATLRPDERPTVDNAIAEEIIDSPVSTALMLHLSAHPDDLAKLRTATNPRQLARLIGAMEQPLLPKPGGAKPPPKIHSDAPAPGTTLGRQPAPAGDPIAAAIESDDVSAYRAARLQERLAKQGRR